MARKIVTVAAALSVTAVGGAMAGSLYTQWLGSSEVARMVASTKGLSVGGVDVDAFGGKITLRDVGFANGSLHVYARRLALPGRSSGFSLIGSAHAAPAPNPLLQLVQWPGTQTFKDPAPPASHGIELKIPGQSAPPPAATPPVATPAAAAPKAAAQTGSASASDVTIVYGATTYTIKKIDLSGTSLSNADLTALLDPKSPATLEERLKALTASSIVISAISSQDKTPDTEFRSEVSQILLANVANGRIGAASAAGATMSAKDAKGEGSTGKTGAIQASGLDLTLITHLLDSVRKDDAEPLKSLSESLTINDISVTGNDGTSVTIASIAQKDLKARPLKYDLKALDDATKKDVPGDDAAKAAKTAKEKAIFDDIVSSYEVGSFTISKLGATGKDKDGSFTFGIASIGLQDFRARKLGSFSIRDFYITGPDLKSSFATFDVANVVIPPLSAPATNTAPDGLATDTMPSAGKADIGKLAFDVVSKNDDGSSNKIKFTLGHIGLSSDQTPGHAPTQGSIAIDNLVFEVPDSETPGAKEFRAMGYKAIDASLAVSTTYDQAAETLAIQKFLLNGVDMGSVNLAVDFGNVNKGIMSANQSLAKASALAILLKRVDIKVLNSGLVEKALDWKAKQDGTTVPALKADLIDFVSIKLPASLGDNPAIKKVGAAVAKFIADPKTLHISAASKEGLGVSDMGLVGAPDELMRHLDIAADANQ